MMLLVGVSSVFTHEDAETITFLMVVVRSRRPKLGHGRRDECQVKFYFILEIMI